jgi:hypothetical protein
MIAANICLKASRELFPLSRLLDITMTRSRNDIWKDLGLATIAFAVAFALLRWLMS